MDRSIRKPSLIVALMLLLVLVTSSLTSSTAGATGPGALDEWDGAADEWSGAARDVTEEPRSATPEDRYALAGGCYAVTTGGAYVQRAGDGFAAIAASASAAEPFRFQATDLGRYLLFGSVEDFVAADGDAVVAAAEPSDDADWAIKESDNGFSITLPSVERALTTDANGTLVMTEGAGSLFGFELVDGCATYPEIEVNVEGPVVGGQTPYQEVRGFVDAHLHMMAFEFLGGRA
ncbi:MAG TPA: hypothetical protein VFS18_04595, partial [Actinomycetota bacterium]|nr:hypothetical protein [Actinomycetota bacterium]